MADKDFVVKNGLVVNTNVLVVNGTSVGVNTTTPDAVFTVAGTANIQGNVALSGGEIVATANATFFGNLHSKNVVYIDTKLFVGNTAKMVQDLPTIIQAVNEYNGFVMVSSQNLSKEDDACADLLIYADDTNGLSNFNDLGINNSRFDGRIHRIIVNATANSWGLGDTVFQRNAAGANIAVGQIRDRLVINSTAVSLKIRVSEDDGLPTYVGMPDFVTTAGSNLSLRAVTAGSNADVLHAVPFFSPAANTLSRRNFGFTVGRRGDGYLYNANSALTIGTTSGGMRETTLTLNTAFVGGDNVVVLTSGNTNLVKPDHLLTGAGIADGTWVTSVINTTAFRISAPATGTSTGTIIARDEFYDLSEANNPIIFHVGGMMAKNEIARFSGTGNFTIGPNTTSRSSKLTVNGTANLAGVTNVGANLNVSGFISATQNVSAISGVFTTSVNVGTSVSVNNAGFRSGNVSADLTTIKIAGNSTFSSVNVAAGNLTIGNASVTNVPLIRVQNSASQANITPDGLAVGNVVANVTTVAVGANVRMNTSTIFVGNASTNVMINTGAVYAVNVVGNAAVSGNLYVGGQFVVTGEIVFANVLVTNGSLLPNSTSTFTIGNVGSSWSYGYFDYLRSDESGDVAVGNSSTNTMIKFNGVYVTNTTSNVQVSPASITVGSNVVINASSLRVGNSTSNAYYTSNAIFYNGTETVNSTSYRGTANSTLFVGSVSAVNVVSNAQLQANLANYPNNTNLSANLARYLALVDIPSYNWVNSVSNTTISGIYTHNANLVVNASSIVTVGNTTTNSVVVTNNSVRVGNSSVNVAIGPSGFVGNLTATTISSSNAVATNVYATFANSATVNATTINTTSIFATTLNGNVVSTLIQTNDLRATTANVTTVNSSTVNAATLRVGNQFVANSTDVLIGVPLTINSNLVVTGTMTTLNTATLDVTDLAITVAKGSGSAAAAEGAGIVADGANASILYSSATSRWVSNVGIAVGNSTSNVFVNSTSFVGNVIATRVIANLTGNVTATTISSSNVVSTNVYATFANSTTVNATTINATTFNGNVVATTVTGNLTGNVAATTITGNLTGNVVSTTISASASITTGAYTVSNTSGVWATHLGGIPFASFYRAGGSNIALSDGGTNSDLAAVPGGIVFSNATGMAISAAGTAGQLLTSGATGAPTWTTPSTLTVGNSSQLGGFAADSFARTDVAESFASSIALQGSLSVSLNNALGGGIILSDDGDIVDLNTGFCSMRFTSGVRVFSGNRTGSSVIELNSNGNGYFSQDVVAFTSDERLKTQIEKIENALEKVKSIRGVTYRHNELALSYGFEDKKYVGVLAGEIEKVLPEVIEPAPFDRGDDGKSKSGQNFRTVKYDKIVPLLIEAIKELTAKVEELEKKLGE